MMTLVDRAATPRRILAGGWLVFLLYAYPGYLKTDAVHQLIMTREGALTDAHPPLMTELWRIIGIVVAGPAGMLVLQSLLLLAGLFALLRREVSDRAAAIISICLLLFPPVLAQMASITPEAQLAAFLIAATAALSSEHPRWRNTGLALMIVAVGLREGAAIAALPIMLATFRWRDTARRWQRIAIAGAAWLAVLVANAAAERLLVDERLQQPEVTFAMSDIVGTLHHSPTIADAELQPLFGDVRLATTTDIQQRAHNVYGKPRFYTASDVRMFEPTDTQAARDALFAARRALIRAYPNAYVDYRLHVAYRLLGIEGARTPVYSSSVEIPSQAWTVAHLATHSWCQTVLLRPVAALSDTVLFRPYLYLALALVMLAFAIVRKSRLAAMLLASGILYEQSLVYLATRTEYRDSLWMITATSLATVTLIAQGIRSRST